MSNFKFQIIHSPNWQDYELLDCGNGKRFERFGKYTLVRPDPQCIWQPKLSEKEWENADTTFQRKTEDKGVWQFHNTLPNKWIIKYKNLSFWITLTPFKHTGVFPEQAVQWDYIGNIIAKRKALSVKGKEEINVLNLFAYTGIATLAAAGAGAKVTHVDASKPAISWARENQQASNLMDKQIRWIVDDVVTFCKREIKRGVKYDGILMDPPIYGHGPNGETWNFYKDFPQLLNLCKQLLSDHPLFIIVNAYAISSSAIMLQNVLEDYFGDLPGSIDCGELTLQEKTAGRLLSTGIFGRWMRM